MYIFSFFSITVSMSVFLCISPPFFLFHQLFPLTAWTNFADFSLLFALLCKLIYCHLSIHQEDRARTRIVKCNILNVFCFIYKIFVCLTKYMSWNMFFSAFLCIIWLKNYGKNWAVFTGIYLAVAEWRDINSEFLQLWW